MRDRQEVRYGSRDQEVRSRCRKSFKNRFVFNSEKPLDSVAYVFSTKTQEDNRR